MNKNINTAVVFVILSSINNFCHSFVQSHAHDLHRSVYQLASTAPSLHKQPNLTNPDSIEIDELHQLDEKQLINQLGYPYAQKILELSVYKAKYGDCMVPKRYDENPSLGNWVNKQRQLYRKFLDGENNSINQERIDVLNRLGFVFTTSPSSIRSSTSDRAWLKMYEKLYQYHKSHGHVNVPSDTPLGQWTVRQRYLYRLNDDTRLNKERINKLNGLGFRWETRYEALWNQRICELKEFKKLYGHCMVPRNYEPNKKLSSWVATQRKYYNLKMKGKPSYLTNERQKQLDGLGFVWSYWDYNFRVGEF